MTPIMRGFDMSQYQGANVDFKKIKAEGYSYVILRVNNWDNSKNCAVKDARFEDYYKGAKEAGLYVGCYWFSFANTIEYVKTEAQLCVKWTEGKKFEMPYYFDIERPEQFAKGKEFCTNLCKTFCTILEEANKFVGIYCSTYYFNYIDLALRNRQCIWVADWRDQCYYAGHYGMWQKGTTRSSGINNGKTDVDCDECYVDYPTKIKAKGKNGFSGTTLDNYNCYNIGQSDIAILMLKTLIRQLDNNGYCNTGLVSVNMMYTDDMPKVANTLLHKWGYKMNGIIGTNFIKKLCSFTRGC